MSNLALHRRLMGLSSIADGGYIDCTYNVTSTSSETKLINFDAKLMSMIYGMMVDGVSIAPIQSYTFDTTGEHNVRMYVAPVFDAISLFYGCVNLTSVVFNLSPDLSVNLSGTFRDCSKLTSIDFGNSDMYAKSLSYMFFNCSSLQNIDLSSIRFPASGGSIASTYAFRGCKAKNIVFGEIDKLYMEYTFWSMKNGVELLDFTRVKSISGHNKAFTNAYQPYKLDFGRCDLSAINITNEPFLDFSFLKASGETIMLGKAMRFTKWRSVVDNLRGTLIYNLEYDYSPLFEENPYLTPQAYEPVNKTLRVRFCTNNAWIVSPSSEIVVNGVSGVYTSEAIWEFAMVADTYKYPIYYEGEEVGEVIVKDDVQQIAFGTNDLVYRVIDFSASDSFDPSIIVSNEGWEWHSLDNSFFGMANNKIEVGEKTSIVLNTGMIGEVILTLAQSSQTYYHFGKIYDSDGKELIRMNGGLCQTHLMKCNVNTKDGMIKFTYDETQDASTLGQERMWIKKIEHYDWPELPA